MLPLQKLEQVLERHAAIEAELSSSLPPDVMVRLSRERAGIEPVAGAIRAFRSAEAELRELENLRDDPASDGEMRAMAEDERSAVQERLATLEGDLQLLLLPKDAADDNDVIIEVRAGTGGDEASLFAGDLFRMYGRYAELQGWTVEVLSTSDGAMGGFKEVVAAIRGRGAFARMKFESGVHRVQRVPATETSGRIHTSAATVAVLPQAEEVDVTINESDLRIDVYRAQGAGGQHVNKTESAVRITHMPSGVVVAVQDERSQHRNKARAMDMLRAKLFDIERQQEENARSADRKAQVGTGDRSARIRTYNFPQGRITDHRIGLTLHKLEQVLEGSGLGELISALIADRQARLLAAENDIG